MHNSIRRSRWLPWLLATTAACGGTTDPGPPPPELSLTSRVGHSMAYDEAHHQLLLFGGIGAEGSLGSGDRGSTWSWNGQSWTLLTTAGPSPRYLASMVYDAGRQRVVLYGGESGVFPSNTVLSDTWEWDGTAWSRVATTGPGTRVHQSMAYDRSRGRVVLYGGYNTATNSELRDIWEWNGTTWTQQSATTAAELIARGIGYDERANVLALYSVRASGSDIVTDVWNGTSLTRRAGAAPSCFPAPSMLVSLGSSRGGLFFYSGSCGASENTPESWRWDGTTWTRVTGAQPDFRITAAMAYDRDRDRVVLFGGEVGQNQPNLADTWEFDGTTWARR